MLIMLQVKAHTEDGAMSRDSGLGSSIGALVSSQLELRQVANADVVRLLGQLVLDGALLGALQQH